MASPQSRSCSRCTASRCWARGTPTWALACFAGTAAALILPAHVVIALLALVGVGSVWTIRIAQSLLATRRLPSVSPVWRRTFIATGIALVATVAWGLLTGHGLGSGGSAPSISPFNASWRDSVAIVALGAGVFLAIPLALVPCPTGRTVAGRPLSGHHGASGLRRDRLGRPTR